MRGTTEVKGPEGRLRRDQGRRRGQGRRRARCRMPKAMIRKHYKKWSSAKNTVEWSSESTTRTLTNGVGPKKILVNSAETISMGWWKSESYSSRMKRQCVMERWRQLLQIISPKVFTLEGSGK